MSGDRIGDSGGEAESFGSCGGDRQRDIGIARKVLRIDYGHASPARRFGAFREATRTTRRGHGQGIEVELFGRC
jgi:hypothetical protein